MRHYRFLLCLILFAACSKSNYVYLFQNQGEPYYRDTKSLIEVQSETVINEQDVDREDILLASANSDEPLILSGIDSNPPIPNNSSNYLSKYSSTIEIINQNTRVKPVVVSDTTEVKNTTVGDPQKNYAATLGLVFSIAAMTIIFGLVLAPAFAIPGIIFSLIGLKSEKKKMAKAGLILSIASLGLIVIWFILLAISGGYGM